MITINALRVYIERLRRETELSGDVNYALVADCLASGLEQRDPVPFAFKKVQISLERLRSAHAQRTAPWEDAVVYLDKGRGSTRMYYDENVRLKDLAKDVQIAYSPGESSQFSGADTGRTRHLLANLTYQGRSESFKISIHPDAEEPSSYGVLESYLLDTSVETYGKVSDESAFAAWADDLGLNPGSRKDYQSWQECHAATKRLHRLLGSDYTTFSEAEL